MSTRPHVFDNDATCVCCGFDGAEHLHQHGPEPLCITSEYLREQRIAAAKRQGLFDEPLENFYSESAFGNLPL